MITSKKFELEIPVLKVFSKYYNTYAQVDCHKRCRQNDLRLEKTFQTKDWSMQVNMSLLGIKIVGSWLLYKHFTGSRLTMNQIQFYLNLADGPNGNRYDTGRVRSRDDVSENILANLLAAGTGKYFKVTNKKRNIWRPGKFSRKISWLVLNLQKKDQIHFFRAFRAECK